jgi:uncharacterized protein (TIGR00299 family) protein
MSEQETPQSKMTGPRVPVPAEGGDHSPTKGFRLPLVAAHERAEPRFEVERPSLLDEVTHLRRKLGNTSGKVLLLDGFAGLAGDMLLGALVDLGLCVDELRQALDALHVPGLRIEASEVIRCHLGATKVSIHVAEHETHRNLDDIAAIIRSSTLEGAVQDDALAVFTRLAYAEARAHRVPLNDIHFHEVGASDAIADICGVTWALHRLGVAGIVASALPAGSGTVRCAHGTMPVPVPAVLHLLPEFTLLSGQGRGEMVTPTGAALLATFGISQHKLNQSPPYEVLAQGYGAGSRDTSVLRLTLAQTSALSAFGLGPIADGNDAPVDSRSWRSETVVILRANIDDLPAQELGFAMQEFLRCGALDAWASPIAMKKNRPAHELCCMCPDLDAKIDELTDLFFRHTSTLGLRRERTERVYLAREILTVSTPYGSIRVKCWRVGGENRFAPEYDECVAAANSHHLDLTTIKRSAQEAAATYFAKESK